MDQSAAQQLSRLEEATVPHSGLGPGVHPGVNLLESLGFLQVFHLEDKMEKMEKKLHKLHFYVWHIVVKLQYTHTHRHKDWLCVFYLLVYGTEQLSDPGQSLSHCGQLLIICQTSVVDEDVRSQ